MSFYIASKTLSNGVVDAPYKTGYTTAEEARKVINRNYADRDSFGATHDHGLTLRPKMPDHFIFVVVDELGNEVIC